MKLFLPSLLALAHLVGATRARMLSQDEPLTLFIAQHIHLDHDEMHRIFSSENHHELQADKEAVHERALAHASPCLDRVRSSVKGHGLTVTQLTSDGIGYQLEGTVKDFSSFLGAEGGIRGGGIEFSETLTSNGKPKISAAFADGTSATGIPESLKDCMAHMDNVFQLDSATLEEVALANDSDQRSLQATPSDIVNEMEYGCPWTKDQMDVYTSQRLGPEATPQTLVDLYGFPEADPACYHPRSVVQIEYASEKFSFNDLQCYCVQHELAPDSCNADKNSPYALSRLAALPNQNDETEPNLDFQMVAATARGSYQYYFPLDLTDANTPIELLKLIDQFLSSTGKAPATMTSSDYKLEDAITGSETNIGFAKTLCNYFGLITMSKHTTIFTASGDGGAGNLRGGTVCGTYRPSYFATCPYVTTVGGTYIEPPYDVAKTEVLATGGGGRQNQGLSPCSGGGFSDIFQRGEYNLKFQEDAVDAWLNSPEAENSVAGYNTNGRAYPDISALAANIMINNANYPSVSIALP